MIITVLIYFRFSVKIQQIIPGIQYILREREREIQETGSHSLGLEGIVGASVVQIMTQAADHQSQDLCIRQNILEFSCLFKTKPEFIHIKYRAFYTFDTSLF